MASSPQRVYNYVGYYEISINGRPYGFRTLVSREGVVAWMPDNEQQHVNPQYRGGPNPHPVWVEGMNKWDAARVIQQLLLFQTKKQVPLEDIVNSHSHLAEKILNDFKLYRLPTLTEPSL